MDVKTRMFLTVNARGSARVTKSRPPSKAGEVSVLLNLTIPDEAFRSPFVEAHLEVPEGFVIKPDVSVWIEPVPDEEE